MPWRGHPTQLWSPYGYLDHGDNFPLLAALREFHGELVAVEETLRPGSRAEPTNEGAENPDLVLRVQYRLRRALDRQELEAIRHGGGYGAGLYREAQYAMAAIADEVLLHLLDWEGRQRWREYLVEAALFQTQIAGERIFDCIDQMLQSGVNADADLAAVYLVILSLGFRGKYRGEDDHGALRVYRQRLRALIRRREASPADPDQPLFAQAYAFTVRTGTPVRLPHARPWLMTLAGVLLTYAVAQQVLWHYVSAPVADVVQRVYAYDY